MNLQGRVLRLMIRKITCIPLLLASVAVAAPNSEPVHEWEKQEVTLTTARSYGNPYTEVTVWVDLPVLTLRSACTAFGTASEHFVCAYWRPNRACGRGRVAQIPRIRSCRKSGSFTAVAWSEAEKQQNTCAGISPRDRESPCD